MVSTWIDFFIRSSFVFKGALKKKGFPPLVFCFSIYIYYAPLKQNSVNNVRNIVSSVYALNSVKVRGHRVHWLISHKIFQLLLWYEAGTVAVPFHTSNEFIPIHLCSPYPLMRTGRMWTMLYLRKQKNEKNVNIQAQFAFLFNYVDPP